MQTRHMTAGKVRFQVSPDWRADFAAWLGEGGRSPKTISAYMQDVSSFAAWFEETNDQPFTPEFITSFDLRGYRDHCIAEQVAPATWNRRRATLALLCEFSQAAGYTQFTDFDPMAGVKRVEEVELAPRWLDSLEQHKLLRQVEQAINGASTAHWRKQALRDQAMIALMLWAGLREAEVAALNVGDVELSERKGKVIIHKGKRSKYREVPLSAEARRALRLWLDASGITEGALFLGKHGERITGKGIQDRVRAIRTAAGLDDDVTPHALRHTFAKTRTDAGVPPVTLAKLMGHARIDTLAVYTRPDWRDLEKAVEAGK